MKKSLKRILVLTFLVVLLVTAPTTTALAASTPALLYVDYSNGSTFVYSYQPAAYTLSYGVSTQLLNIFNSNGDWIVPAYKTFHIQYSLYDSSTVRLTILKMSGSTFEVVYNSASTNYGLGYSFTNNSSSDATYRVLVSGESNALLTSYIASIK
ncbi:hypothetical protein R2R35_02700 [Anaerocolumna sp. AGMB13020]|uniref:hypothetical protein n=1 Tax=Anaerocolumna sp. AGMB13020 TaxID=3081750 RepID=UPI0029542083|nr:hypothetical protein [Anaerocolumna sp. AGMB13020]WOO37422.1 hypothetical protein R2R35_02700 [Anaerocolumna sp. AGMB13020]